MKVKYLNWVHHSGNPIFTIDLHPKGQRFATGGNDNSVRIWQYPDSDSQEGKQLFVGSHAECVNCVRWSGSGQYLASTSDKTLIIWVLVDPNYNRAAFGSNAILIEKWNPFFEIQKVHTNDAVDLCWSPDDLYIASCSVDNTIAIISLKNKSVERVLQKHQGSVKGVAWDPTGKFFASQSENDLIIWNIKENWQAVKIVDNLDSKPSIFRRLSWSPDGGMLAAPCGKKESGLIFVRQDDWKEKHFRGHSNLVTNAKWNPKIFYQDSKDEKQMRIYLAFGSENSSISIWRCPNDQHQGPIVCLDEVFKSNLVDMSWGGTDSLTLIACSTSKVACLCFTKEELGITLSDEETQAQIKKLYGEAISTNIIAESPYQIAARKPTLPSSEPRLASPSIPQPPAFQSTPQKQTETKLPSGKRRINPVILNNQNTMSNSAFSTPAKIIPLTSPPETPTQHQAQQNPTYGGFRPFPSQTPPPLQAISNNNSVSVPSPKKTGFRKKAHSEDSRPLEKHFKAELLPDVEPQAKLVDSLGLATVEIIYNEKNKYSQISYHSNNKPQWSDVLQGRINLLTQNPLYVACASKRDEQKETSASLIWIFSAGGSKLLLPCISFGEDLSFLQLSHKNSFLLAVGRSGKTKVWDLSKMQLSYSTSFDEILIGNEIPCIVDLNAKGQILAILEKNNRAFVYYPEMQVWCKISDEFYLPSEFININKSSQNSKFPLARIQYARSGFFPSLSEKEFSLSHLKHQVSCAHLLESPEEYKQWIKLYVSKLTSEGCTEILQELCLQLLGTEDEPLFDQLSKHSVLSDLIPIMNENRSLQRLVNQIREDLKH